MHVAHLSLADFRSYARAEVPLGPGVTAFLGPNGQGKTNLVEAVGYIATLGSHRVAGDAPLIRQGAERAVVRAAVVRDDRQTLVELELNPGRANRARINRSDNVRPRDVLGLLRTVLFAPEDLALVKGDPGDRRRFLDELLVARSPRLAGVRQDYERVLKQRNALLKSAATARRSAGRSVDLSTLDVWDDHLARAGSELTARRLDLVAALDPLVGRAYAELAGAGAETVLEYRSAALAEGESAPKDAAEAHRLLLEALGRARKQELERGVTLIGPHRDDLTLRLGSLPAKGYASHGESWSYALALRLASYELLRMDELGAEAAMAEGGALPGGPVLVLDDVFAELDAKRRERLATLVAGGEQVLVTAAVPEDVPPELSGVRFSVRDGLVERVP
jgi:DNA replication and repair protein RecF